MARFKKPETSIIQGKFIHINRDSCGFYVFPFNDYCKEKCLHNLESKCMEKCEIIDFIEFIEKKWKMCENYK